MATGYDKMAPTTKSAEEIVPFTGFGSRALTFFDDLAANQTREWFADHKAIYEAHVLRPMQFLVEALSLAFAAHDIPLTGSAKASIFRIHRDVRFDKDKSPYKTNAGAVMSRDGTKNGKGILYIQVGGEERAFLALGFYGPEPADLTAIRSAVAADPDRWDAVVRALDDAGLALTRGNPVTRMPKGFEAFAQAPFAETLRLRSFIASRQLPPERLLEPGLIDDLVQFAQAGLPLLAFGRNAIDHARGARFALDEGFR